MTTVAGRLGGPAFPLPSSGRHWGSGERDGAGKARAGPCRGSLPDDVRPTESETPMNAHDPLFVTLSMWVRRPRFGGTAPLGGTATPRPWSPYGARHRTGNG